MQPASSKPTTRGGGFLLESTDRIFTPEQFTDEHRAIAQDHGRVLEQRGRSESGSDPAPGARGRRVRSAEISRTRA